MNSIPENFRIVSVETSSADGLNTVKAELGFGSDTRSVFFRTSDAELTPSPEAWFCLALLPAMKQGADLGIDAAMSPRLLQAAGRLMDIFCSWYPDFHRTRLLGTSPTSDSSPVGTGVGSFFTGGMDSFYTLLKHREEITHVIFVHGADVSLGDTKLRHQVSTMLSRVENELKVTVIEIESNVSDFLRSNGIGWDVGHIAGLTAIGHLLAPHLKRIYIPSSFTYAELFPWGSHPLSDPLWSSGRLEFVHDGNEASRVQKAALLASSDLALQSLRVCFRNYPDSAYNCGTCEKCVRTMINLRAAGALDRCTTFPNRLDLSRVKRLAITKESERAFLRENLRALESHEDRELHNTLLRMYRRPIWLSQLYAQFSRRIWTWKRSLRRRLGLESRGSV